MVRRLIAVVYRATLRSDDPNEVLNGICYVCQNREATSAEATGFDGMSSR